MKSSRKAISRSQRERQGQQISARVRGQSESQYTATVGAKECEN